MAKGKKNKKEDAGGDNQNQTPKNPQQGQPQPGGSQQQQQQGGQPQPGGSKQQKGGQKQPQQGGPPQQQGQQQGGPQQQQRPQQGQQQQQGGPPQQQQQRPQQGQQQQGGKPQQQQQQRPQQGQQQQGGPPQQQQQRPQQGQQQQGGKPQQRPQQGQQQQGGPPQQQQRPQQGQQQQGGKPQQQQRPQQGQQQQGGKPQQQQRPQQGQQQQGGPPQQQQQRPQQGQQQQGGKPQQQQQQRPQQGQQQQGGPPQQQQQRPQQGQQQQGGPPQQQQRPQQGQQQQGGPPQQQQRPQQGQQQGNWEQRGGPQQQQQRPQQGQQQGNWEQRGGPQQQQQRPQQGQQQGNWEQRGGPQQQQQRPQQGQQQGNWEQRGGPQQGGYAQRGGGQGPPQQRSQFTQGQGQGRSSGGSNSLETNYLELDLSKMPDVAYHYDVAIEPPRPKKFMRPAFELFSGHYPDIVMAFDGSKSCYTTVKLPGNELTHDVKVIDASQRECKFKVTVKETSDMEVDLGSLRRYQKDRVFDKPMRALQCLEVVLANPCHERGVRAGRSFYRRPDQRADLEGGYELWIGLYQAALLGDQPFLNVDIAHKCFPSGIPLVQFIQDSLRSDPSRTLERYQLNDMQDFLKLLNVVYEPPSCFNRAPTTYRVNSVTEQGAARLMFTTEDGKKLSVADYYASKNYRLRYPNLNCLHVGSSTKNIYLPIELCRLQDGQATNKKVGPRQVANIIKYAATSTNVRKEKIETLLRFFNHNDDNTVRAFGIGVRLQFVEVPYRVLAPPMLIYNGSGKMTPRNGSWNSSLQFYKTSSPNDGHKWAIIYAETDNNTNYNTLVRFAGMMVSSGGRQGVKLHPKPYIAAVSVQRQSPSYYVKMLENLKKDSTNLVVVVLPMRGFAYADIKQTAELKYGILTQCIKSQTLSRKLDDQVVGNLLLKVNAKLNGTNHIANSQGMLKVDNNKIMFMGADVTHPSPDQEHLPSVVGTAASHDAMGACYNMQYRLQSSKKEDIEAMDDIMEYHLKMYKTHQGTYPSHVVYYRDGVSDGQFPIIIKEELNGFKKAFSRLNIKGIAITCIIVVKRHHTRFFPKGEPSRFNKFNNVEPGTLVDKRIVHPNEMQFFMVSHQSIQGTAKPTRYNVIYDDKKLTINQVQEMSHALCHMFPRCNRAVSYPAPAYLAHLVAYRGRVYLEGTHSFKDLKMEYQRRLINKDMEKTPMYFV